MESTFKIPMVTLQPDPEGVSRRLSGLRGFAWDDKGVMWREVEVRARAKKEAHVLGYRIRGPFRDEESGVVVLECRRVPEEDREPLKERFKEKGFSCVTFG